MGAQYYHSVMRKTTFVRPLSYCVSIFCLVTLSMICLPAFAQDETPAATIAKEPPVAAMPSDPKELMLLAAKTNRLTGDDVKPWHLKATYKLFDEKDNITDQGTYEEFWVSPSKYKLTFTSKTASRTEYGTEKGILNSDNEKPVDTHDIRRQLLFPMGTANWIENADFIQRQVKLSGKDLRCLNRKNPDGNLSPLTLCLDTQMPILRASSMQGNVGTTRNRIITFQGHYIAGDLTIFYSIPRGKATVYLDSIEALNSIDEAVFSPPSSAVPEKIEVRRVNIAGGIMAGAIVSRVAPEYPPIAKAARVSGTVVLQATISKEGKIESLHVISGPAMLQQAALDAVKQWVYKPYMLNNEPVEVLTTINVNFTLNR
jgi:TonB family protein